MFYLLKSIFYSLGLDSSHIFAYNVLYNVRHYFATKINKLPLEEIITRGVGAYRQNFVDDIESIEILLAHGLPEGVPYLMSGNAVTSFLLEKNKELLSQGQY